MTLINDVWLPRIGTEAARTLEKSALLGKIGVGAGLCMMATCMISELEKSLAGEANGIMVGLPTMVVFSVLSTRLQIRARRQAGSYLQLPPGAWKYLTVRSYERFDRWMAGRDNAGWPAKGWR